MTDRKASPGLLGSVPERVAVLESFPASHMAARNDNPQKAEEVIAIEGPLGASIPHQGVSSRVGQEVDSLASPGNTPSVPPPLPPKDTIATDTLKEDLQTTPEVGREAIENVSANAAPIGSNVAQSAMNNDSSAVETVKSAAQGVVETGVFQGAVDVESQRGEVASNVAGTAMEMGRQGAEKVTELGQTSLEVGRIGADKIAEIVQGGGQELTQSTSNFGRDMGQGSIGGMVGGILEDIDVKVGSTIVPAGSEDAAAQLKNVALVEHDIRTTTFSEPQVRAEGNVIVTTTVQQKRAGLVDQTPCHESNFKLIH
jgi:hypothetical protein